MPRCPVCAGEVDLRGTATAPFCSARCRSIDMKRWLDESYAVPLRGGPDDEDEEPPPADPADDE